MGTRTLSNYQDLITFTRASGGHALRPVSYGSELVTNGDFSSGDLTGWTTISGSATVTNGEAVVSYDGANGGLSQYVTVEVGKLYEIKGSLVATTSSSPRLKVGTTNLGSDIKQLTAVGDICEKFVATTTTISIFAQAVGDGSTTIDNISVKEVTFDQPDGTLTLFEHPDNVPRVEYDADGNRLGLLVEESRTNLVTDSQDFSASSWTKTNTATLSLDSIGPDGQANSAVKLIDDSATGTGVVRVFDNVGVSTSTDYTFSVYAKADQLSKMLLFTIGFTTPSNNGYIFDLNDGTYTAYSGTPALTPSVEYVGNGWYRCSIKFTTDATDTSGSLAIYAYDTSEAVALDGTSSILIYGAQFEEGSFPTSYIKTTGATATRSADVASIPVADFGFNTGAGTFVAEFDFKDPNNDDANYAISATASARIFYNNPLQDAWQTYDGTAGVTFGLLDNTGASRFKAAVGVKTGSNVATALDGAIKGSSTSATSLMENLAGQTLYVGGGSTQSLNGHIKSIKYYPRRLTDAQLQDITS